LAKVRLEPAGPDHRYGDIFVDTNKSFQVYQEWLKKTRPTQVRMGCGGRCGCCGRSSRRRRRIACREMGQRDQ
jgi:hypothetical protein